MTHPLRIGIVGLGKMGQIRAKTIRENSDTVLIAGTDPQSPLSGLEGMRFSPNHDALIRSDIDAVFVCTPNRFTSDIVVAALDAGKHVFCEKPPGRHMDDVEQIIAAERRNPGRVLKFGFNHRYHLGIQQAKQIIDSKEYGEILWMRGIYGKGENTSVGTDWRSDPGLAGGGILLDQGIHMLDLFRFFCGEFVEVKSMCTTAYWDSPLEDNAFALLRDSTGRIAMLHSSFTQWKHRFTLEVYMADGFVLVEGMPSSTRSYRDEWITYARKHTGLGVGNPTEQSSTFGDTDPSWQMELAEFVECIRNEHPVKNGNSRDAYEAMRLVQAIYNSDEIFKAQQQMKERNVTRLTA